MIMFFIQWTDSFILINCIHSLIIISSMSDVYGVIVGGKSKYSSKCNPRYDVGKFKSFSNRQYSNAFEDDGKFDLNKAF